MQEDRFPVSMGIRFFQLKLWKNYLPDSHHMILRYTEIDPTSEAEINRIISSVVEIKAFFHRIRFSSSLGYSELRQVFPGKIVQSNNSKEIALRKTRGAYNNAGWIRLSSGQRVESFYNTYCPGYPPSMLNITSPTVEDLAELDIRLFAFNESSNQSSYYHHHLQLSSVEYTLDFICRNSTDVGDLFHTLRRNCYFPGATNTELKGGNFTGWSHEHDYTVDREINSLFFVNFGQSKNKMAKIYERGDDNDKEKREIYWRHVNCDRVRFEYTFKRNFLKKVGLNTVVDLLADPKFHRLFCCPPKNNLFQMKRFVGRKYRNYHPPKHTDNYTSKTDRKKFECLTEEILYAKEKGLNSSQNIENHPFFAKLIKRVELAILEFEKSIKLERQRLVDME